MSASGRLDLDNELNRNDETHNDVDFEDGDFPALKLNYDRKEHAHVAAHLRGMRPTHPTKKDTLMIRENSNSKYQY